MKTQECFREQDVIDAVRSGQWPDRCEPGLRAHVDNCAVCREVATVAVVLQADHDEAWDGIPVPSAAHVWWRAQMRARREAAQRAARPTRIVEGLAAASAAGLALAAIAIGSAAVSWGWADTTGALQDVATRIASAAVAAASSAPDLTLTIAAATAVLLVMPVAVYFALSEK